MTRAQRRALMSTVTITMTLEEAYILKCAAWDGPEPNASEQRVLARVVDRIESTVDKEVYRD